MRAGGVDLLQDVVAETSRGRCTDEAKNLGDGSSGRLAWAVL